MSPAPTSAVLSADAPITEAGKDRLGRAKLVKRIALEAVTAPADSGFVIGLCGEWGSGKSSIANLVEEELQGDEQALVVRFDPWFFAGTSDLLGAFFAVLADALGRDTRLKKAAGKVKEYAGVLSTLATAIPAVGGTVGAVMSAAASAAEIVAEPESLQQRRNELAEALRAATTRVVVIIDDVDRLADSEVAEIVRLAKLVGDLPAMTYILSFDRVRVEEVLGGGNGGDERARGRAYMEKIIQSRFDVPPVRSPMLADLMVEQLNELLASYSLTPPPQDDWINLLNFGIRPLLRVPRDGKRFANAMPAAVELVGDEVALVDLLALEAIRIFEPDIHTALPGLAELLTAGSSLVIPEENKQRLEATIARSNDPAAVKAILGRLFPESRVPLPNPRVSQGARAERRERRVSQAEVLRAYLYATLDDDALASAYVRRLVDLFADPAELQTELSRADPKRLPDLLDRLLDYELDYKPSDAVPLLLAFVELHGSDDSDDVRALLAGRGPLEWQLQFILKAITTKAPTERRAALAGEAFAASPTLSAKLLVLHTFGAWSEEEGAAPAFLDRPETDKLADELAALTLGSAPEDLATERRAVRLLSLATERDPEASADDGRIEELLRDDGLMLAVLNQAMVYGSRTRLGDASGRLIARVRWYYLTSMMSEGFLRGRVVELDAAVDRESLDPKTAEALSLAVAVARGEAEPEPDL